MGEVKNVVVAVIVAEREAEKRTRRIKIIKKGRLIELVGATRPIVARVVDIVEVVAEGEGGMIMKVVTSTSIKRKITILIEIELEIETETEIEIKIEIETEI